MTFLQIIKLTSNSLQIICKIVHIQHHPQHVILFKPVRFFLTCTIHFFQRIFSLSVKTVHFFTQFVKHPFILINFHVKPFQFINMSVKPALIFCIHRVLFLIHRSLSGIRS